MKLGTDESLVFVKKQQPLKFVSGFDSLIIVVFSPTEKQQIIPIFKPTGL